MPNALHVLVIDDDPIMTELLTMLLSAEGHSVLTADTGNAALYHLRTVKGRIDVVLTDLNMPGLHGKELAVELTASRPPHTTIIGMSGSAPTDDTRRPFDAFLMKPFTTEDFNRAVQEGDAVRKQRFHLEPAEEPVLAAIQAPAAATPTAVLDEPTHHRLAAILSPDKLAELYKITVADIHRRLNRIAAAQVVHDDDAVRKEAHAIKGGCGMVGATELAALALALETGATTDTPSLTDFTMATERLQRMLDSRN